MTASAPLVPKRVAGRYGVIRALELFEREAAVLPTLRHAGVPEVYERLRDVWDGVPTWLLVMEYVEGRSATGCPCCTSPIATTTASS